MLDCFIITWHYGDRSGHGVVAAFEDSTEAQTLLDLLNEYGERVFELVKIVDNYPARKE